MKRNMRRPYRKVGVVADAVVDPDGILALILPGLERVDPVGGSLTKTGDWLRIDVEKRLPLRADAVLRNDVVGKRLPCHGIGHDPRSPEVGIGRIEEFTEVPAPHGHRRHRQCIGDFLSPARPLFAPEEEQLAAIRVELARNEDRPAHREAVLVVVLRGSRGGQPWIAASVPRPGVGVQRVVLKELRRGAMKVSGAAFCHHAHDARRRAPVLRGIVRREDLHFLDGVHVLRAEHRVLGRARAVGDRPIDGDQHVVGAPAADRLNASPDARAAEIPKRTADDTRLQPGDEHGIAAAQRELLNLLLSDGSSENRTFRQDGSSLHFDGIAQTTNRQRHIDADPCGGADADSSCGVPTEAGDFSGEIVGTNQEAGEHVKTFAVGDRDSLLPVSLVRRRNRHTWNDSTRTVPHEPRDLAGIELGACRSCDDEEGECRRPASKKSASMSRRHTVPPSEHPSAIPRLQPHDPESSRYRSWRHRRTRARVVRPRTRATGHAAG